MMFLTSCEVAFFLFILVCLETTICVMYVPTYSLCSIYQGIHRNGLNKVLHHNDDENFANDS